MCVCVCVCGVFVCMCVCVQVDLWGQNHLQLIDPKHFEWQFVANWKLLLKQSLTHL